MKVCLILLLFASCSEISTKFYLQKSFTTDLENPNCFNDKSCFCFSGDDELDFLKISYSVSTCQDKELIDSVEYSPYESMMYVYNAQKNNSCFILWETLYEYFPVILSYYVSDGKLTKVGEMNISLPCDSCEKLEYPLSEVDIVQINQEIVISFIREVNYRENNSGNWEVFSPGTLKFYFDISKKEFGRK